MEEYTESDMYVGISRKFGIISTLITLYGTYLE
jgi:hypothetical protein